MWLEDSHRKEGLKVLKQLVGPTASDANCLHCDTYVHAWDGTEVMFLTEWTERCHLDSYLSSDKCHALLSVMDLSSQPPQVKIEDIPDRAGLEYIAACRQDKNSN
jgi:quinol monooxygenase YgiN